MGAFSQVQLTIKALFFFAENPAWNFLCTYEQESRGRRGASQPPVHTHALALSHHQYRALERRRERKAIDSHCLRFCQYELVAGAGDRDRCSCFAGRVRCAGAGASAAPSRSRLSIAAASSFARSRASLTWCKITTRRRNYRLWNPWPSADWAIRFLACAFLGFAFFALKHELTAHPVVQRCQSCAQQTIVRYRFVWLSNSWTENSFFQLTTPIAME